ncbi:MAG: 16S rRNA (uracil(1498)-N(3))-methyltransferase [Planctomycetes bacterium]|nr:16S rRNA (uracil(1498)-N(3))-methyltransferase [Planctomycetota bacterium]
MNLLLLRDHELIAPGEALLRAARARHVLEVLGLGPGDSLRIGLPDGPTGLARIESVGQDATIRLRHQLDPGLPSLDPDPVFDVLLALPRPKVLARLIRDLAAMGAGRIVICRSWKVEKSYFDAEILAPGRRRELLLEGLEQGVATRVPEILIEPLFRPFVEDRLDDLAPARRFVAQPGGTLSLDQVSLAATERFMLAIGPEGGFIPFEIDLLAQRGFEAVTLGPRVLRVEAALLLALGSLWRSRR